MPLHYIQSIQPSGVFAVWENKEPHRYFEERLKLNPDEVKLLSDLSERKKLEWLSSRYLLHIMTGAKVRTLSTKDEHGKPGIKDSAYHISLSHSGDRTAVIASRHSVGIDIQKVVSKIGRIAKKFCNEDEFSALPNNEADRLLYYHIIWGAKECIYKSYGKRKVDFKKHMNVSNLDQNLRSGSSNGKIEIGDFRASYKIEYHLDDDYMIVTSIEEGDK